MGSYVPNTSRRVLGILVVFFFWVGRGWVAVGWVAAGSRQAAATHPDGNGNGNDNGNNGNELSGARCAPNQRAQG